MSWRPGIILRNIHTGKPLKVIRSYKGSVLVVDLESKEDPTPAIILLERDYDSWIDEKKLTSRAKKKGFFDEPLLSWGLATAI